MTIAVIVRDIAQGNKTNVNNAGQISRKVIDCNFIHSVPSPYLAIDKIYVDRLAFIQIVLSPYLIIDKILIDTLGFI